MRSIKDIAWLAGIVEGEGCVIASSYLGMRKENAARAYPVRCFRLAIEMCDLDVLQKVQRILGPCATVRERISPSINPKHRRRFILQLTGPVDDDLSDDGPTPKTEVQGSPNSLAHDAN
jgi:hypothetical protein